MSAVQNAARNVKGGSTNNSVSVRADARQHVIQKKRADTTELQRALSSIHGVIGANDMVVAASHDEALAAALTLLASKCLLLQQASYKAALHKANITTISNLFVELLNNLSGSQNEVAMISNASVDEHQLASLLKRISSAASDANKLACSCQDPGWLAQLARSDVVLEQFQMISKAVTTLLQSSAPKLNISTDFQWLEVSSKVRAILRAVGDGVLERGIARLGQEQYVITVEQLSALLSVPIEAILEESRNVGLASLGVEIIMDDKLRSKEVERVFHEYAKSCRDVLTEAEFNDVLHDMGLLDDVSEAGKNESRRGKAVELFVSADSDFDRMIGFSGIPRFVIKYLLQGYVHTCDYRHH